MGSGSKSSTAKGAAAIAPAIAPEAMPAAVRHAELRVVQLPDGTWHVE